MAKAVSERRSLASGAQTDLVDQLASESGIALPPPVDVEALLRVRPTGELRSVAIQARRAAVQVDLEAARQDHERLNGERRRVVVEGSDEDVERHDEACRAAVNRVDRLVERLEALDDAHQAATDAEAAAALQARADAVRRAQKAVHDELATYDALAHWIVGFLHRWRQLDNVIDRINDELRDMDFPGIRSMDGIRGTTRSVTTGGEQVTYWWDSRDKVRVTLESVNAERIGPNKEPRFIQRTEVIGARTETICQSAPRLVRGVKLPVAMEASDEWKVLWPPAGVSL